MLQDFKSVSDHFTTLHSNGLISITSEKFEFYKYKMHSGEQKVILHVARGIADSHITPNSMIFRNIV